jgi:hypothetical protein
MNEGRYSEQFQAIVLDPEAWRASARALIEAASLLEPKVDEFWRGVRTGTSWNDESVAVHFMLSAFALKNLLKARLVERRHLKLKAALESGSTLPNMLKDHDLSISWPGKQG